MFFQRERLLAGFLVFSLSLFVILCAWFPLTDTDIWWHLAAGRWIFENGQIPKVDPFCLSSLGETWLDLHWGFQVLSHLLWNLGGAVALLVFKCIVLLATLLILIWPGKNLRLWPFLFFVAVLCIYSVRFLIDLRPILLTLLALAIQWRIIESAIQSRQWGKLWWMLPPQVSMVNVQGLYLLGPISFWCIWMGSLFIYGIHRLYHRVPQSKKYLSPVLGKNIELRVFEESLPSKKVILPFAALCGITLLNPYGYHAFSLPFKLFKRIQAVEGNVWSLHISENMPFRQVFAERPGTALLYLWCLFLFVFSFELARRALRWDLIFFLSAFVYLGWSAERNIPLLIIAGLFVTSVNLKYWLTDLKPVVVWKIGLITGMAGVLLSFYFANSIYRSWSYHLAGSLETPYRFPSQAIDFMESHAIPGPIFNELRYGGYITYRLFPKVHAFVDGRMVLHNSAFFEQFLKILAEPNQFQSLQSKYHFTQILLPIAEFPDYLKLLGWLIKEGQWTLVFCDGASAYLVSKETLDIPALVPMESKESQPLENLNVEFLPQPIVDAIRKRYHSNPKLLKIAVENTVSLFIAAGNEKGAYHLLQEFGLGE